MKYHKFSLLLTLLALPFESFAQGNAQRVLHPPTFTDVPYGDHPQQVLDFWQSDVETPGPLAVYFHSGGYTLGSKKVADRLVALQNTMIELLAAGIHVASIEYRFVQHAKLPAAHKDVAKAVQFLRHQSRDWKINKNVIGAWGSSSGAQLSAYLAWHDSMADPNSEDPIARESTRLTCVALRGGQASLDLNGWIESIPGYQKPHREAGFFTDLTGAARDELIAEVSIINHITPDDPPVYMSYRMNPNDPIPEEKPERWSRHHVNFGIALEEKLRKAGVEVTLSYPGQETQYSSEAEFMITHLLKRPAATPSR
jgi:acetyl esterase